MGCSFPQRGIALWAITDMFCVYILTSEKSGQNDIGSTLKDVHVRLKEHNAGGSRWTKGRLPFKLVYYEGYACKEDTLSRERFLKSGFGNKIVKAIVREPA